MAFNAETRAKAQATIEANKAAKKAALLNQQATQNPTCGDIPAKLSDENVWMQGLIAGMRSRECKHASDVKDSVDIADEVLAQYKAKFK